MRTSRVVPRSVVNASCSLSTILPSAILPLQLFSTAIRRVCSFSADTFRPQQRVLVDHPHMNTLHPQTRPTNSLAAVTANGKYIKPLMVLPESLLRRNSYPPVITRTRCFLPPTHLASLRRLLRVVLFQPNRALCLS